MSKCGIEVCQQLKEGILEGPYQVDFSVEYDSVSYNVLIEQCIIRKIILTTGTDVNQDTFIKVFNEIDKLIMLGEGKFIPIFEVKWLDGERFIKSDELTERFSNRLKMFDSADFTIGSHSDFLSFNKYINESVFSQWITISKELDILHHMVLYSMANTGVTVDCKCAFLIESFEALSELIEMYDSSFKCPCVNKGESKLGKYLDAIINEYGKDIFKKELDSDIQKVIKVFVNSRNRIAHIKSKQNKIYLNGAESVLYAVKMSYLYRTILLRLLGVNYNLFSNNIIDSISLWDEREKISDDFLQRI